MTNPSRITRWLTLVLMGVAALAIVYAFGSRSNEANEIPVSTLAQEVRGNEVSELQVAADGQQVNVVYADTDRPDAQAPAARAGRSRGAPACNPSAASRRAKAHSGWQLR